MHATPFFSKKNGTSFFSSFIFLFALFFLLTGCESRRVIVNNLDEREANEILVFLTNKQIDATKVQAATEGGGGNKAVVWNISVESTQAADAMALLNQAGLPRRKSQNLLAIFGNQQLVPSGMQEKIRFQAGTAEQIASIIRKIDGVLDADVQISFPDEDPLNPGATKQKITASVYVKHSGVLDDPNAHLITRIKRLVASSVNGLDYDNVTVIPDRARFGEGGGVSLNEGERPYVNVWSIIVAQSSLSRFRLIFFTFTIALVLLTTALVWLIYKFLPLIQAAGGIKGLFSIHPIKYEDLTPLFSQKKEKAEEAKEEENGQDED